MTDTEEIIKTITEQDPQEYSPFSFGEWYDGWESAINYVVSVLKRHKEV